METWGVFFLGVIALCSMIQAAFLIAMARQGMRLSRRLDELRDELRPGLVQLARLARSLAEVSDLGVLQARRLDALLADTLGKIEETTAAMKRAIVQPLATFSGVLAFFKGVRRGVEVYRQLSGGDDDGRGSPRLYGEDEHLFI